MPSLKHHHSDSLVKVLQLGDSKAGKTMSLISLVKAKYKLFILDMDNLLDGLHKLILRDCPELIDNVEVRSLRDNRKGGPLGPIVTPKAYVDAIKMLDNWKYTEDGVDYDFGKPSEWGPDCILVIDSLSRFADAAYAWADAMTPAGKSGEKDGRAIYGMAQDALESNLAGLTAPSFRTNVIVIAHIIYQMDNDGKQKGYPQGIGQKLSPKIPQYFPSVVYCKREGDERTMFTASTKFIDLANPAPFAVSDTYPTETGLAEFFRIMRDQPQEEPKPKPTKVTSLRR